MGPEEVADLHQGIAAQLDAIAEPALLGLRGHLDAPTWEAEDALWQRILDDAGVNLTPGSACRNPEPGFLRVCFAAAPTETVLVAIDRIAAVLG